MQQIANLSSAYTRRVGSTPTPSANILKMRSHIEASSETACGALKPQMPASKAEVSLCWFDSSTLRYESMTN